MPKMVNCLYNLDREFSRKQKEDHAVYVTLYSIL